MGRKKDPKKDVLIDKLGLSSKKNWTMEELLEAERKHDEKEAKDREKEALTRIVAGDVPETAPADLAIPYDLRGQEDPFSGLTERQKRIARLRLRGLSQQAIANLEQIAQPIVSRELKRVKEWQAERGGNVDQNVIVGNTSTLYEEVEQMAWSMYYTPSITIGEKAKCLSVVMSAREKHTNLLMDLGLIKRASTEVKVQHEVSPFLQRWNTAKKQSLATTIVTKELAALPEPQPDDVIDGEVEEPVVAKEPVKLAPASDLEEPTFDDEDLE